MTQTTRKDLSDMEEILGYIDDESGVVTMMFIDTILEDGDDLYHRAFFVGEERRECIDEDNNVYLVAIDQPKEDQDDLYEMINTTVYMLKEIFGYDLSKYQEYWLADERVFAERSSEADWNTRNRVFWNDK